jgi:hypothetical protein
VINVIGVKSGGASAKLALGDQFLVERIARPAKQPLGRRPEIASCCV